MKAGRTFLVFFLLPAMLAVTIATLVSLWSLYSLQQQNQNHSAIERMDLSALVEAASVGAELFNLHKQLSDILRDAKSGRINDTELHQIENQLLTKLDNHDRQLQRLYKTPKIIDDDSTPLVTLMFLADFSNYRDAVSKALEQAVGNPEKAHQALVHAQTYYINISRHQQSIAVRLTKHALAHNQEGSMAFDKVLNRVIFTSVLGLLVMVVLSVLASRILSRRLDQISHAMNQLTLQPDQPPRLPELEQTGQSGITPLRDMANAVLTFRNALLELGRTRAALEHHRANLEDIVRERTRELSASEARLIDAQRIAHLGNWEWEINTGKLHWSDEIYRLLGWAPQSFAPDYDRFLSVVHPEDIERTLTALNTAIHHTDHYEVDHRLLLEDGSIRYVQERGQVIRDEQGNAITMVGVVLDLTEQIKAREDLELFKLMIEKNADPMFLIDIEDNFRMSYVNEAAVKHFGASKEEILSWHLPDWDPNFNYEALPEHKERALSNPDGMLIDTVHRTKTGKLIPVEVSVSLTRYKDRLCHFGHFKNIRERKEAENTLLVAKERAEEAARIKSEFLANMSHEIRTPMNAIINLSRLTLQSELSVRQRSNINKVLRAGEGLLGIINDVLDFSKIESGQLSIERTTFSLETVIDDVTDLATHRLGNRPIEFLIDIPTPLPIEVIGDPLRLIQVLTNLLSNAIKFTEQGEVTLKVETLSRAQTEIQLKFSIIDTGIGISEEQQQKLFQPFQQADGSITRRYGGTGLGLVISRRLLNLMQSRLEVSSIEGVGSDFSFVLTLDVTQETAPVSQPENYLLSTQRSLVVDDNPSARNILLELLKRFGSTGHGCDRGDCAIHELETGCTTAQPYGLVFIDYDMPGMNGIATMNQIMANADIQPKPKAILLTSKNDVDLQQHAMEAGFTQILEKPINASKLLNLVLEQTPNNYPDAHWSYAIEQNDIRPLSSKHVLLVEDNEINQEIAIELLEAAGMAVITASNGQEAIDMLRDTDIDLVLMDLQMPVMDGIEATRLIRQQPQWKNLPIIAMTAHAMTEERERCFSAGMNDHLAKPIDIDQFYRTLKQWLAPNANLAQTTDKPLVDSAQPTLIPGIDMASGLARVANNQRLYHKLLHRFHDNYQDAGAMLNQALEENRLNDAKSLAHNIKGIAGNLGCRDLSHAANALELAISEKNPQLLEPANQQFQTALSEVIHSLQALQHLPQPVAQPLQDKRYTPTHELVATLEQIASALNHDLRHARQQIELLANELNQSRYRNRYQRLNQAIADYDTDLAGEHLRQLILQLRGEQAHAS